MKRVAVVILFILAITPNAVYSEEWQNKISFEMPSSWKLLDSKSTSSVVAKLYYIREDNINGQKHPSSAVFKYYPVPSNVTIAEADRIVARTKGATQILSADDGPYWKTYLLANYEESPARFVLYRIGIADGVAVELLLSFPSIDNANEPSLSVMTLNKDDVSGSQMAGIYCKRSTSEEMVALFNSICTKIKISNKNQYKADVRIINVPANAQAYRYVGESKKKE